MQRGCLIKTSGSSDTSKTTQTSFRIFSRRFTCCLYSLWFNIQQSTTCTSKHLCTFLALIVTAACPTMHFTFNSAPSVAEFKPKRVTSCTKTPAAAPENQSLEPKFCIEKPLGVLLAPIDRNPVNLSKCDTSLSPHEQSHCFKQINHCSQYAGFNHFCPKSLMTPVGTGWVFTICCMCSDQNAKYLVIRLVSTAEINYLSAQQRQSLLW